MLGKISRGHALSTSTSVYFLLVVGLCLSFKLLHKHSVFCVFHRNGKVCVGGPDESLVTKGVRLWQAGSSGSHMPYVSGLKQMFSSIICLSSMSFHNLISVGQSLAVQV